MTFTQTENQPKRRDQLVIMAEIIQIAKNGTSKTHIMFKANLSFSQLNLYLQTLTQTGLLEKSKCEGKEIYKATQQGLDFMEKQCQIISLFNVDLRKNNIKTSFAFNPFSRGKLII